MTDERDNDMMWDAIRSHSIAVFPLKDGRWAALAEPWSRPCTLPKEAEGSPWSVAESAALAVGMALGEHLKLCARRNARLEHIRRSQPRSEPCP